VCMSWRNVKLIYLREIRDQLRDRRTLFMIAVLPLLLYPLIGMTVFQLTQFLRKNEARVVVVGSQQLTENANLPALLGDRQFPDERFDDPTEAGLILVEKATGATDEEMDALRARLKSGDIQVVIRFPDDFGAQLERLHEATRGVTPDRKEAATAKSDSEAA